MDFLESVAGSLGEGGEGVRFGFGETFAASEPVLVTVDVVSAVCERFGGFSVRVGVAGRGGWWKELGLFPNRNRAAVGLDGSDALGDDGSVR